MGMQCDFCQAEPGLLLIANQETGDTQSAGPKCTPTFLREMSQTFGVWPNIEDVLTDELILEEARKRGLLTTPAAEPAKPAPRQRGGRKPASAGADTIAERAATTRADMEPTDYSRMPDTLLTPEELAERQAEDHRRLQEATGGQ